MICSSCKNEIFDDSRFCNFCGAQQNNNMEEEMFIKENSSGEEVVSRYEIETKHEEKTLSQLMKDNAMETDQSLVTDSGTPKSKGFKKSNKSMQKKPNKLIKGLKIGCGTIVGLFILLVVIALFATRGMATLTLDDIEKEVMGDTLIVKGSTDIGNILVCNGQDYSNIIDKDGKFKISIPLNNMGENEFVIYAMKSEEEKSKNQKSVIVNRINDDFKLNMDPTINSKIEENTTTVKGNIKEPNVAVKVTGLGIDYDLISDENGDFEFELDLTELGTYTYSILCSKEGFNNLETQYHLERVFPTLQLSANNVTSIVHEDNLTISGKTEPQGQILVSGDVSLEKTADASGNFSFSINTAKEGPYNIILTVKKDGFLENIKDISFIRELSEEERMQVYKSECINLNYKELKKSPDKYMGTKVKYTGQVLEIQESGDYTVMRIAVTNLGYGIWDFNDVIWVEFYNSTGIIEDNIINVYGEITGSYSYTSIAGWQITIPAMEAEFIQW